MMTKFKDIQGKSARMYDDKSYEKINISASSTNGLHIDGNSVSYQIGT